MNVNSSSLYFLHIVLLVNFHIVLAVFHHLVKDKVVFALNINKLIFISNHKNILYATLIEVDVKTFEIMLSDHGFNLWVIFENCKLQRAISLKMHFF